MNLSLFKPLRFAIIIVIWALMIVGRIQAETSSSLLQLPLYYLPAYSTAPLSENKAIKKTSMVTGQVSLTVPTARTALVLMDTWNTLDPQNNRTQLSEELSNIRMMLAKAREHGMVIIHAPNHPVVNNYSNYAKIRSELVQYDTSPGTKKAYLQWAPWDEPAYSELLALRQAAKSRKIDGSTSRSVSYPDITIRDYTPVPDSKEYRLAEPSPTTSTLSISRYLTPLENEFVIESYSEFRYVLHKHKISTILYTGGALNECILHRQTGINGIAGTDSTRLPFIIVVLEDSTLAMPSLSLSSADFKTAMLEYLQLKLAFTSNQSEIRFFDP